MVGLGFCFFFCSGNFVLAIAITDAGGLEICSPGDPTTTWTLGSEGMLPHLGLWFFSVVQSQAFNLLVPLFGPFLVKVARGDLLFPVAFWATESPV